ncbi:MAG: UDP-3-O-[3-hydroxymyristoyl] N-acetylglucosamine deacetylase [Gammaproteobacteria bacterium RIFCSPLOWO2_02_FULL_42_14]|nr:MAG: UDP-3-O-[3-hydroxymyristoyl] N-acetylglucosamine deacetylase [Gammaproteobacteria bacterium RIFCSPHIGHO2_02_FULL_42_43]OGT52017.1 MAG: UDP-3-O-[3-hydroxymyristoyl] N-acetylglucosamine deacetylase [Gammaproteobacteria bacterium RIFCSPHIGHO2_12_FULL_41_25]OGT61122.1 MAG: UDP-3-O-[3-hydroxymyristoyl] N-acetylglucosamine deacetylase [Gammaproteobacteria bacterium RIFCSPLOWO2_02_FULL_42_14]OGT87050.1 MAG: UDP-3-O-[3-hydroxymyristoyl] N-acetylglucosamine deacetylase [Gammaproteobacteria bacter
MTNQQTIQNSAIIAGIGLHSGKNSTATLKPAPENTGIVFRRVDLDPVLEIPAIVQYADRSDLCTCLLKEDIRIATVEHLLSALSGLSIDNVYIDLSSAELPMMDGSALPFVVLIQSAGILQQAAPKKLIRILKTVEVRDGEKFARLEPFNGFRLSFQIAFQHPVIASSQQSLTIDFSSEIYIKQIARARTFGFLSDYEKIHAKNLARGASLENTIVLNNERVMNDGGLRDPDEFVKHKMLDAIGDLYLLGHHLIGAFTAYKSSHALTSALLLELLKDQNAWRWT